MNTNVTAPYQKVEYSKFIQLDDTLYPSVSVVRTYYPDQSQAFPDNYNTQPVSSIEIYPKYGVLTHLTNPDDIKISLSAENINVSLDNVEALIGTSNAIGLLQSFQLSAIQTYTDDLEKNTFDTASACDDIYWESVKLNKRLDDSSLFDAFGRLRVSQTETLLDAKHLHDKLPFVFDEAVNGTATSTFSAGESMVVMTTQADGDYVIRQTRIHYNYQPGKGMQGLFTGTFAPQTNIIKRVGLMQSVSAAPYNIEDGLYLEVVESGPRFCVTKNANNTTVIPQSAWNVDKLDGTGPSGVTIDFTKAQIFSIDYEWLGVGRVRFGFVQSGKTYYAHYENHANELVSPYIKSPNQPVHYEIRQVGAGSGSMNHICSTVMIEGGEQDVGKPISISDNGITLVTTEDRPLLFVRYNPAKIDSVAYVKSAEVLNAGNSPALYKVYYNPTISGTQPTWIDVPNTAIQYANGSTSTQISGTSILFSSFMAAGIGSTTTAESLPIAGILARLGSSINHTPDVIVLTGRGIGAGTTLYGVMNLVERA